MPDTQICRHCKNLWPAELLFSVDGACPRCQANRPPARSLAIDEFEAEAELRAAIEDAEAELVGLRAILATYVAEQQRGPLDPPSPESEAAWEDYKRRAAEHLENS